MSQTVSFTGIGASPGVAVGHAFVIDARKVRTPKVKLKPADADTEVMRFKTAITLSDKQLEDLKTKLSTGAENEHGLILEAHRMMLHDPMFIVEVTRLIKEDTINAEWAVRRVCRRLRHQFDNLAVAARVKCPVLVVHGDRDAIVPAELGRQLCEAFAGPREFVVVPGAGHNNLSIGVDGPHGARIGAFLRGR